MTILEMITEWKKGCSCGSSEHPENCHECTTALITAIENKVRAEGNNSGLTAGKRRGPQET